MCNFPSHFWTLFLVLMLLICRSIKWICVDEHSHNKKISSTIIFFLYHLSNEERKEKTHIHYLVVNLYLRVWFFICFKYQVHIYNSLLMYFFPTIFSWSTVCCVCIVYNVFKFRSVCVQLCTIGSQKPNAASSCYRYLLTSSTLTPCKTKLNPLPPNFACEHFFPFSCGMSIKCVEEQMKFNIYIITGVQRNAVAKFNF